MIDVHSHILPSVDDGAQNMEEAVAIARLYAENGYRQVIATPHYLINEKSADFINNRRILEELNSHLRDENIDLEVLMGNELFLDHQITDVLVNQSAVSLNGSKYLLIELPMSMEPIYADNVLYEISLLGYVPIIAHPERYRYVQKNPDYLLKFLSKGYLMQLNLSSLMGYYGDSTKQAAISLLKSNYIQLVGTDTHSLGKRSPKVSESLNILKKIVGENAHHTIVHVNPELVLNDEYIAIDLDEYQTNRHYKVRKKIGMQSFFYRLLGNHNK